MKPIVLTGMSGCGKSTIGKFLSQRLAVEFIDIDEEIEKKESKSVSEIFDLFGEKYFRDIEKNIIFEKSKNGIISLGGGAFEDSETREFLLKNSLVIYLETSPEIIFKRLKNTSNRPLLKNISIKKIDLIIKKREKNYKLAPIKILTDNKKIESVVEEIIKCAGLK
ncbi:shikimate kinase [bacterium]|nr:shikimate kinase [bacterium]